MLGYFPKNCRQISVDLVQILTGVKFKLVCFSLHGIYSVKQTPKLPLPNCYKCGGEWENQLEMSPLDVATSEKNCQCDSQLTKKKYSRYAFHLMVKIVDELLQNDTKKTSYFMRYALTHWGRVTHIWVSKPNIIDSDNGLSPGRRQVIIGTNDGILLIGPLGTYLSEILIEIYTF